MDEKPLRAFPPKNLPWGTGLELRQGACSARLSGRVPVGAATPGHPEQLALWRGGFPVRAYPGETTVPSRG